MSRLVHATCRYFLRDSGPGAHRGLVAADDPGEDDQRPDRRVRCGHRAGGAVQQRVHPPVAGPDPGHRREDVRAPLDRDVVHHHQEHTPGLEVQPVGHRARRARLRRGVCDVDPAARALHLVPGVLDGQSPRLGQVGDLVRVPHPQVAGIGQVSAAAATALREVRDDVVRDLLPGQERARRAGLLARLAAAAPALPALRRLPPRQVISARRHRRVPAVAGDQPLQPRDPVLQLRDLGVLVLQQHPQPLVRLPQPPVLRAQCGRIITGHTGSPGRIRHPGTTSKRPSASNATRPAGRHSFRDPHLPRQWRIAREG